MNRFKNDPRHTTAKFNSTCAKCNKGIKKGESMYYFPATREGFCESCGKASYDAFVASAIDEDLYNGRYF